MRTVLILTLFLILVTFLFAALYVREPVTLPLLGLAVALIVAAFIVISFIGKPR